MLLGRGRSKLVGGTVTVSHAKITTACTVLVTRETALGTLGDLAAHNIINGTSFDIVSANILDTSFVNWVVMA